MSGQGGGLLSQLGGGKSPGSQTMLGRAGGDPGRLLEWQGGVAWKECWVGHVGTDEAPSEPVWLSQACASGPKPTTPSPFKNKNKYLGCMLCALGFSFLLKAKNRHLSASLWGFLCRRQAWHCARPGLALWVLRQVLT